MDWVFIEILKILIEKAKIETAATNAKIFSAKPIHARASASKIKETNSGKRLSNLDTSQPEMGRPIRDPMGMARSRFPNSASFRWKLSLILGILEAQDEKKKPEIKKYVLKEMRCFDLVSICSFEKLQISVQIPEG